MLLIVLHHSMVHGTLATSGKVVLKAGNPITFGIYNFLAFGGKVGVYIFVLITGYFMVNSKISVRKIIKLWLPIFFWSVMITLSFEVATHDFSVWKTIKSVFPILFSQYWFMTVYFFMYLLIPIMNTAIKNFSINQEIWCVILGMIIMFPNRFLYGSLVGGQLVNFVIIYLIGAFIRKNSLLKRKWFTRLSFSLCWLSMFLTIVTSFSFSFVGFSSKKITLLKAASFLTDGETQTFFCLFIAMGMFAWIGSKKLGYHKCVNTIASTTFGIYLIHDNGHVQTVLWNGFFHMKDLIGMTSYGVAYVFGVVLLVFVICSLLEFTRKKLFGRLENIIANKLDAYVNQLLRKSLNFNMK